MIEVSLQVAVVMNGKGCRLGSRIRWEIVAQFPWEVGVAIKEVRRLMLLAKRW